MYINYDALRPNTRVNNLSSNRFAKNHTRHSSQIKIIEHYGGFQVLTIYVQLYY